jgi:hypothetical protein
MKPTKQLFVLGAFAAAVAGGVALAQEKIAGEKWRTRTSMQTDGFSMPERTMEVCLPKTDKPDEAMLNQQQAPGDCKVSNIKRSGNKTSADLKCTGPTAMEGHWEVETVGDTVRGTMAATMAGRKMTTKFENTKLGQACEVPPVPNAREMLEQLKKQRGQPGGG